MQQQSAGIAYGIAAYGLWGLFPLYFLLFTRSGALEIVAHRALWSLAFCLLLLGFLGQWRQLLAILGDRRAVILLGVAGLLIVMNWCVYVAGVNMGRALEAAMGYFINPLAVAMLGVVVLGERLRPLQWVAVGLGLCSVVVMMVAYGQLPWIALTLAGSFGCYSLVKKVLGRSVAALPGLAIETGAVAPLAAALLCYLALSGQATSGGDLGYAALLASTGIVTAVPLLLFAATARRVSMLTLAVLQYLAPIGQFLLGWLVLSEPMPTSRWIGFSLVWGAVAVFLVDALVTARRHRRT